MHPTKRPSTTIGNNVSIAHNAIVHGCTIHDNVLVGMGSILMDHVVVESNSIIAARVQSFQKGLLLNQVLCWCAGQKNKIGRYGTSRRGNKPDRGQL
ncbi:MAG: hypothetical protein R2750_09810 [Bacteroidales bacterium]